MSSKPCKVLLAGDVGGSLQALFKRVAAVNKNSGPFDLLLCTGSFFPHSGPAGDEEVADLELLDYLTGSKQAPVPTYFIGAFGQGSTAGMEALAAAGAACSVKYLGRAGLQTLAGLNLAFLDGFFNPQKFGEAPDEAGTGHGCRYFTQADVQRLKTEVEASSGDVDIFLSCEWPAGITSTLIPSSLPKGLSTTGSPVLSDLAQTVRPRYHVAGTRNTFWARPPYSNKDLGAGAHVTRFISLGSVDNPGKQKWLHALGMVPAAVMDLATLHLQPEGTTPCPYEALRQQKKRPLEQQGEGGQDWRWQSNKKPNVTLNKHIFVADMMLASIVDVPLCIPPAIQYAAPSLGDPDVVRDDSKTLFVRNLPFRASEQDIREYFAQAGPVVDVRRQAADDGKLKGWGHVQFASVEARERACQLNGSDFMGRELFIDAQHAPPAQGPEPGKPVNGCWFCLSNPNADVELVASIGLECYLAIDKGAINGACLLAAGEECYLAIDKGAINDNHVLLVPIEHYPSTLTCSPNFHAEMERYLSALRSCFAAQGQELVAFERFLNLRKAGGNHAHVNVLPIPAAAAKQAPQAFQQAAQAHGFDFQELPPACGEAARQQLRDVVGNGEYLLAYLPDGSRLVHPVPRSEKHPLMLGRQVAAELCGAPARADWKLCQISKAEEQQRTERFREQFKSFDIVNAS